MFCPDLRKVLHSTVQYFNVPTSATSTGFVFHNVHLSPFIIWNNIHLSTLSSSVYMVSHRRSFLHTWRAAEEEEDEKELNWRGALTCSRKLRICVHICIPTKCLHRDQSGKGIIPNREECSAACVRPEDEKNGEKLFLVIESFFGREAEKVKNCEIWISSDFIIEGQPTWSSFYLQLCLRPKDRASKEKNRK